MYRNYSKLFVALLASCPLVSFAMEAPPKPPIASSVIPERDLGLQALLDRNSRANRNEPGGVCDDYICEIMSFESIRKLDEFKNPSTGRARKLELLPDVAPFITISPMRVGTYASGCFNFTRAELSDSAKEKMKQRLHKLDQIPCIETTTIVSETGAIKKHYSEAKLMEVGSYAVSSPSLQEQYDEYVRTHRLETFWHNLHPVAKAGVVGATALATSYGAKKLYEFMQKQK